LPFKDGEFDVIYASHILEHIQNLVVLKKELTRILKNKGLILVIVPHFQSNDAWGDDTHVRAFSTESFLLSFWPGFENGEIKLMDIQKHHGPCKWIIAYMYKGEN
jgi:ubiquinone/menaquinone biosynthesis C-methylase UbiE